MPPHVVHHQFATVHVQTVQHTPKIAHQPHTATFELHSATAAHVQHHEHEAKTTAVTSHVPAQVWEVKNQPFAMLAQATLHLVAVQRTLAAPKLISVVAIPTSHSATSLHPSPRPRLKSHPRGDLKSPCGPRLKSHQPHVLFVDARDGQV